MTARVCPTCGAPAGPGDRFCEIDGTPIDAALAGPAPSAGAAACSQCGAANPDDGDGYCSSCGYRLQPLPAATLASATALAAAEAAIEVEEVPSAAAAMHRGLHRDHNEDAFGLASGVTPRGEPFYVLVVCDGVSSSTNAEQASKIAARVVTSAAAHACRVGDAGFDGARKVVAEALRNAHVAIFAEGFERGSTNPPGTTCVAALVIHRRVIVGWAGDSRAYWLTERGGELLTRDHSWAVEAATRGELTFDEAMRSPNAHAITRCLGPLESGDSPRITEPEVVTRDLAGPGVLLLCSDGLWNYHPKAEQMAAVVRSCASSPRPADLARSLVKRALADGGHDNVSVVVYAHAGGYDHA